MDGQLSFWQFGDELRGQSKVSEDHQWFMAASKLAEQTRLKGERMNNLELSKSPSEIRSGEKTVFHEDNKYENIDFNLLALGSKVSESVNRTNSYSTSAYNMNSVYQKGSSNNNNVGNFNAMVGNKFIHNYFNNKESTTNDNINTLDKRFKTLPSAEMLPRNEVLGGYIFVCNNDTMEEDLKRLLFGLPPRYRDSVRAITPGLPLFLYNYTTHQLHGIFEAVSFGGSNIDPTAWEDKKCKGESRFPAQVRIRVRKIYKALDEDAFRPVLHHYDGPKFRLELSIPETLALLDLCKQENM
ncbi:hypothetical protein ACHQM5_010575 [Ranunculus cassubicifolius]